MEHCSLFFGDQEFGTISWTQTQSGLHLEARCGGELGMIYRAVLQTEDGFLPLGVMLPSESEFVLKKELPGEKIPICAHIDRTLPGERHLPGLPVAMSAFAQSAQGLFTAYWAGVQYLLIPLEHGKACSAPQFLSIAAPLEYQKNCYGLFCQKNGRYLPYSDSLFGRPMIK